MKHLLLTLSALCLCMVASAQDIDKKILALQKGNATYSAPFTETKVFPKLKKESSKQGTLTWQAEEYLRMDYSEPAGDYTLIEPGTFTICLNGKVQKLPAKDASTKTGVLRQTLLLAFQGKVADIAELNKAAATYSDKGGNYVCTLEAEQPKHGVKALALEYDKKTGHLLLLTITESNGNYTTWTTK